MAEAGSQGLEQVFYLAGTREILDTGQVEEYRALLADSPRKLAKFNKAIEVVTAVWTWQEQRSRFSPFDTYLVKADIHYVRSDGTEFR